MKCPFHRFKEIWKDIAGYEGYYQVSNSGKIRSVNRIIIYSDGRIFRYNGRDLKTTLNKGYVNVKLSKHSKVETFKVHRLVAEAFISNPLNLPQINHKDENKTNNNVDNLEWCTGKYNMNYGTVIQRVKNNTNHKLIGEKLKNKNGKKLYQYSLKGKLIKIYPSIHEAVRNGFDKGAINRCIKKKVKTHKGFIFSLHKLVG
ncbi:NUMOD4 domain-containing protein [Clostridium coskatii]|uniref:NUMOD4 domain-containing protein n=1 Tax=Clostridium coskatii TaxID=1705578 RepID=UPI0007BF7C80